ncbi:hypothetical protein [Endozoicomonas lisbonensis]|uniref:Uncharacterized protein n=1 Tax=Endozoicomonas lisbonensis TaxID=3120522 RepID=A0ABV2SL83_9GAMM
MNEFQRKIDSSQLEEGDVLFKIINHTSGVIAKSISFFSPIPLWLNFSGHRRKTSDLYSQDPCKITHVAFSMGQDGLFEYDETRGIFEIMRFRGAGVAYTPDPSFKTHGGKEYLVVRCVNKKLSEKAYRKALTIHSCWATSRSTSYGIRKAINSFIFQKRGPSITNERLKRLESRLINETESLIKTNRVNFFCSEFVAFIYIWAAIELAYYRLFDDPLKIFGTDRVRLIPSELFCRMLHHGQFIPLGRVEFTEEWLLV